MWSEEEQRQVVEEAVRLSLKDTNFIWSFIAQGQAVLPEARRRIITGRNGINDKIIAEFCAVRQEILERGVPFAVNIEKPVMVERPREEVLQSITTKELIQLVAERMAPLFELIPALLHKRSEPHTPEVRMESKREESLRPVQSRQPRKPRVLMYGFLPGQEKVIAEKAANFNLELKFLDKEVSQLKVPPTCQWCVSLDKIRHAASDKLRKSFKKDVFFVHGVESALKKLAELNSLAG